LWLEFVHSPKNKQNRYKATTNFGKDERKVLANLNYQQLLYLFTQNITTSKLVKSSNHRIIAYLYTINNTRIHRKKWGIMFFLKCLSQASQTYNYTTKLSKKMWKDSFKELIALF